MPKLRNIWFYVGSLVFAGLLVAGETLNTLAAPLDGQGGGNTSSDNSTVLIIGGLVVILVLAGVGLIFSRRKK